MTELIIEEKGLAIYCGDSRNMTEIPNESVQCVVTSPPYWGLRKYSGDQDLIWGDNHCEHEWVTEQLEAEIRAGKGLAEWSMKNARGGGHKAGNVDKIIAARGYCIKCQAWRGAYGLEPTPEMYIEHTVEILREIRRVLRKDGVVFWNIGDCYVGSTSQHKGNQSQGYNSVIAKGTYGAVPDTGRKERVSNLVSHGLKPKDLCLIPFRVAIAAQEDGWWVRSVIIWSKLNPMPESVKDRPTETHEYILMLTKSSKYYWDADAVREQYSPTERWGG